MDVKSEINHLSATQKELVIEVPEEVVREEFDKTYAALSRSLKVAGFRPGKVPRSVIKQKFYRQVHDTVAGQLLPQSIRAALAAHNLDLIAEPEIYDLSLQEGHPLRFRTRVEVLPQLEMIHYQGLHLIKRVKAVTEAEVDQALEHLRQQHSQLIPVDDRPAEVGDFATITLQNRTDPTTPAQVLEIEIGSPEVLPDFSENLRGLRVGQSRCFQVNYSPRYHLAELAGRRVEYEATLEALRTKELPDLDDEFPLTIGEDVATLADLRQEIKRRLQAEHEEEAEEALKDMALQQLVEAHPFEVPEFLVRSYLEQRLRRLAQATAAAGLDPQSADIDWEAMVRRERDRAIRDIRAELILQKIAEQEALSVSETELQAEINSLAAQRHESPLQAKRRLTKESSLDSMKNELRKRKALELVVKAAVVRREVVDGDA